MTPLPATTIEPKEDAGAPKPEIGPPKPPPDVVLNDLGIRLFGIPFFGVVIPFGGQRPAAGQPRAGAGRAGGGQPGARRGLPPVAGSTDLTPLLTLRRPASESGDSLRPVAVTEVDEHGGAVLACARCRQPVTTAGARIDVGGGHEHTFANPHDIRYRIGCFSDAAGCAAIGFPSTYFTWFPGFAWQVGCCVACGEHLGWLFRSADSLFYGLILDRLVEIEQAGG